MLGGSEGGEESGTGIGTLDREHERPLQYTTLTPRES